MSHNAKAIHTTTKTKTPFRKPKPPVTPSKPKLSKKQGWLLATLAIAAVLFLSYQIPIYREKRVYREAEKQITQFVDEAAKLAPSTKEIRKYCSYSSEKYGKGGLGCTTSTTIIYGPLSESRIQEVAQHADNEQSMLKWQFVGDNTQGNKKYISENYIKSRIYDVKALSCGVQYMYAEDKDHVKVSIDGKPILKIEVSCTGPALKEYY